MEVRGPKRTRTEHFVLRLNNVERAILDRVAERLGMSASEAMRYLIRRADEEARRDQPPDSKRSSERESRRPRK